MACRGDLQCRGRWQVSWGGVHAGWSDCSERRASPTDATNAPAYGGVVCVCYGGGEGDLIAEENRAGGGADGDNNRRRRRWWRGLSATRAASRGPGSRDENCAGSVRSWRESFSLAAREEPHADVKAGEGPAKHGIGVGEKASRIAMREAELNQWIAEFG